MKPGLRLSGLRVLVVEDEMLVSLLIEELLLEQHCVIVGPFDRLAAALGPAQEAPIDLAVVDVNLAGEKSYPVAEALWQRGIPFLLVSGYGQAAAPHDRPDWRVCDKPFRAEVLLSLLEQQVAARHGGHLSA